MYSMFFFPNLKGKVICCVNTLSQFSISLHSNLWLGLTCFWDIATSYITAGSSTDCESWFLKWGHFFLLKISLKKTTTVKLLKTAVWICEIWSTKKLKPHLLQYFPNETFDVWFRNAPKSFLRALTPTSISFKYNIRNEACHFSSPVCRAFWLLLGREKRCKPFLKRHLYSSVPHCHE